MQILDKLWHVQICDRCWYVTILMVSVICNVKCQIRSGQVWGAYAGAPSIINRARSFVVYVVQQHDWTCWKAWKMPFNRCLGQVRYGGIRWIADASRPPCDGTISASVWPSPRQTPGLPCPYPLDRTPPEACGRALGMVQPPGSRKERIQWAGFSTGSRATCPWRRALTNYAGGSPCVD